MYEIELNAAIEAATSAGAVIREHYSREIVAEQKLGVDNFAEPVTIADRIASRMIVEHLEKAFPGDAILSEEEADDHRTRLASERVWMIDPIDGTSGFIRKDDDFAVQIGLVENGEPIVGVVYLPARDVLYFASKGGNAFHRNGERLSQLRVSEKSKFSEIDLAVSRNHRSPKMSQIVREFGFRSEIGRGSVGVKIGLIAEAVCDLYIHLSPRTKFWDTCAPQIILEEAGGKLTDIFGDRIRYDRADVQNHNGILAANGAVHEKAVKRLAPLLAEFGRKKYGFEK